MQAPGSHHGAVLEGLGISLTEERIYAALLEAGGGSLSEVARATGVPRADAKRALAALESLGLVSRSADPKPVLLPLGPDVAVDMLVARRHEELERARLAATTFVKRLQRRPESGSAAFVEVVRGGEAIRHRIFQMQRATEHEFLGFDKPPYVTPPGENVPEETLIPRGIRYRVVYDSTALEYPGHLELIEQVARLGEEARVSDDVPMKLGIADRKFALVPLNVDQPGAEEALIVHPCSLLDALRALFEAFWESARPIGMAGSASQDEETITTDDRRLVELLNGGLKEGSIASQLGISARTVERRITRLMKILGIRTRFQLGVEAEARGWLES